VQRAHELGIPVFASIEEVEAAVRAEKEASVEA